MHVNGAIKHQRTMAKKQYKIRAKLVFSGQVTVAAHSRQEAEAMVEKNIAGQLGRVEVQPEAEERIQDWDFSLKGEQLSTESKRRRNNGTQELVLPCRVQRATLRG